MAQMLYSVLSKNQGVGGSNPTPCESADVSLGNFTHMNVSGYSVVAGGAIGADWLPHFN